MNMKFFKTLFQSCAPSFKDVATGNVTIQLKFRCSVVCRTVFNPMDCSTPGFPVYHRFLETAQTHVHRVSGAIQSSHPLSSSSPPMFNLSQHQRLFEWVSSSHQVAKGLEFQLQHQSFQPWVRKIPWRRKWQSTPVLLPGKSHGQRSLVGYSPWGCKESDDCTLSV